MGRKRNLRRTTADRDHSRGPALGVSEINVASSTQQKDQSDLPLNMRQEISDTPTRRGVVIE